MPEPLTVRVLSSRALVYTDAIADDEDRPAHVRAASAIAAVGEVLYIVQDDAGFIACVRGDAVTSIALPRGPNQRRRFEARIGNKLDKLDLESCVVIDGELWAFGSGTIPIREHVVRMRLATHEIHIAREPALYARLREAIGGAINVEGVAHVGDALWFFHRGNTSERDAPAIVQVDRAWNVRVIERVDLGRVDGVAIGFTDACAVGDHVVFIGAAESSANAIEDGRVLASVIGVRDRNGIRTIALPVDHKPEGLAMSGPKRAWITVDPDDPDAPTMLYELAIDGIKPSK